MFTISSKNKTILRWVPAIVFMFLILFLSTQNVPKLRIMNADKVVHFVIYGMLSLLVFWPLSRNGNQKSNQKRPILLSILATIAVGILDETIQHFNPARVASLLDLLADSFGAVCSVGLLTRLFPGHYNKSN